ncbi:MAG: DUF4097 family beta strand repeat-containing protein [Pseudoalteromonas prydzensis]|uniref:DUF4097 family beta strand repeat-containing protein n=1 Tax=Pseudoalteromonas prydzensis TaxID=182141 RepID=UPI003F97C235
MTNKSLSLLTKSLPIATSLLLLSGCVVHISTANANIQQQQQRSISAAQLQRLDIESEAGSVRVIGSSTATEITVDATIYTVKSDDPYILTLEQKSGKAVLTAKNNQSSGMQIYQGNSPSIDLVVTVPSSFSLDIEDGSGDINVQSITGNLKISDGSGSITINNAAGNLKIEDGSGDINLVDITGSVDIDDNSGSISAKQLGSYLTIWRCTGKAPWQLA